MGESDVHLGKVGCEPGPCSVTDVIPSEEWGSYAKFMKVFRLG